MQWHKEIPQTFRCAPKIIHQGVQMCDLIYMKLLSRQNSLIGTEVPLVGGSEWKRAKETVLGKCSIH